jgi:hypothetical protein
VPERISKLVPAVQRLFEDLGVDVVEERVLRFILQEIHDGKNLKSALAEPYVVNNTSEEWRSHVLERPEVVDAVEEEVRKKFSGGGD